MGKFSLTYKNVVMFFPVAFPAERDPVAYFIAKANVLCKGFNMMRVKGAAPCAAMLTCEIIPCKNIFAPVCKFFSGSGNLVLMGAIDGMFCDSAFSNFGTVAKGMFSFGCTRKAAKMTLATLCLKFRHWLSAVRARCFYLEAGIANAFRVGFLVALKTISTNKAGFADTPKRCRAPGDAWSTRLACRLPEFTEVGRLSAADNTRRKISLIAGRADSIITSVFFTYLASIFHVSNLSEVANEVK